MFKSKFTQIFFFELKTFDSGVLSHPQNASQFEINIIRNLCIKNCPIFIRIRHRNELLFY